MMLNIFIMCCIFSKQFVTIYAAVEYSPISLDGKVYPKWPDDLGMCMSVTVIVVVPLYMIYRLIRAWMNGENIKQACYQTMLWLF